MGDIAPFLVQERMAQPVPGIGQQHVGRAIADGRDQRLQPLAPGQIGLDRLDRGGAAFLRRGLGRIKIAVGRKDQLAAIAAPPAWSVPARSRWKRR